MRSAAVFWIAACFARDALRRQCRLDDDVQLVRREHGIRDVFSFLLRFRDLCEKTPAIRMRGDVAELGCVVADVDRGSCGGKCPVSGFFSGSDELRQLGCENDWLSVDIHEIERRFLGLHVTDCYATASRQGADITSCGLNFDFPCLDSSSVEILWAGQSRRHVWANLLLWEPQCPTGVLAVREPAPNLAVVGCVIGSTPGNCSGRCTTDSEYAMHADYLESLGCEGPGYRATNAAEFSRLFHKGRVDASCYSALADMPAEVAKDMCGPPLELQVAIAQVASTTVPPGPTSSPPPRIGQPVRIVMLKSESKLNAWEIASIVTAVCVLLVAIGATIIITSRRRQHVEPEELQSMESDEDKPRKVVRVASPLVAKSLVASL